MDKKEELRSDASRVGNCQLNDRIARCIDHLSEGDQNGHPAHFLFLGEAYGEGRLEIRFLVEDLDGRFSVERNNEISDSAHEEFGRKVSDLILTDKASHCATVNMTAVPTVRMTWC